MVMSSKNRRLICTLQSLDNFENFFGAKTMDQIEIKNLDSESGRKSEDRKRNSVDISPINVIYSI